MKRGWRDSRDGCVRAPPAGLDARRVTLEPGVEHGLDGVLAGKLGRLPLAMRVVPWAGRARGRCVPDALPAGRLPGRCPGTCAFACPPNSNENARGFPSFPVGRENEKSMIFNSLQTSTEIGGVCSEFCIQNDVRMPPVEIKT